MLFHLDKYPFKFGINFYLIIALPIAISVQASLAITTLVTLRIINGK